MTASAPGQATLTHLQQLIAGLTEGVILLAADGRLSWADETALTLHGARKFAELGGTTDGYRDRFALAFRNGPPLTAAEYPMARLLDGDAIDRVLITVTRRADGRRWVHETRTMVLRGTDGQQDCLCVIINDETERFNAEERFERTFAANPAPAIIARLSDMRYVKVNHGFLELTGYLSGALIGRSMHEFDVLLGADRRDLALKRLHAGQTIPQMEGCLVTQDGGERTVLIGGQPLEIGDEACMLFTFADLHQREQALAALRQTEERFGKAFHMAPCPMAILDLDGMHLLDVNDAFTAATGWRREEIIGRAEADLHLWGDGEPRASLDRHIRQGGSARAVDIELHAKDGTRADFLLSVDTVEIQQRRCLLCVMLDISARRATEVELLTAVHSAMEDTSWLGQKIVEKLATITRTKKNPATQADLAALPARARQVLDLLAQGLSDEAIAARLSITRNTLRNHIAAIYGRLGIHKRSAVVIWARERGLGHAAQQRVKAKQSRPRKTN